MDLIAKTIVVVDFDRSADLLSKIKKEMARLSPKERAKLATEYTVSITDLLLESIAVRANLKHLAFSQSVRAQIPTSRAAYAYNSLVGSLVNYEIICLVRLWDKAELPTKSIPTVQSLINDPEVIRHISEESYDAYANRGWRDLSNHQSVESQRAVDESMSQILHEMGLHEKKRNSAGLKRLIRRIDVIATSVHFRNVSNLRNKHIAHNLTETRLEKKSVSAVSLPTFREVERLLSQTVRVVESLNLHVRGSSFDIRSDSAQVAKKRADELWLNCKFHIPAR